MEPRRLVEPLLGLPDVQGDPVVVEREEVELEEDVDEDEEADVEEVEED